MRRDLVRAVSVGVVALAAGACSSDTMRFSDNPFANPFGSSRIDMAATGSIPTQNAGTPPPSANIANAANNRVASSALPPPSSRTVVAQAQAAGQNIVNRPGSGVNAAVTGFNANGWTAAGGSQVVLAHGESVNALANRYGVPAEAIYKTNGLSPNSAVTPGTRLTIPVYRPDGAQSQPKQAQLPPPPAVSTPTPKPAAKVAEPKPQPAPATSKTASREQQPAQPAKASKAVAAKPEVIQPKPAKAKPTTAGADPKALKPAPRAAEAKPIKPAPKVVEAKPEPIKPAPKVAEAKPAAPAPAETKVAKSEKQEPQTTGSVAPSSRADFRWPARGRIISGFNNGGNQGINIAVPEGTPVKAADEGTVAYAGSELKGYGNLVLVRHANGYVSAYAHNGDLKVKKGDSVKRGQTIATSGQTGNVSSPQLHFEIRKGSTPVDPTNYLQ